MGWHILSRTAINHHCNDRLLIRCLNYEHWRLFGATDEEGPSIIFGTNLKTCRQALSTLVAVAKEAKKLDVLRPWAARTLLALFSADYQA